MKYKVICVVVVVAAIIIGYSAQNVEPEKNRYHQHLEAAEKTACTDHGEDTFCTHLPLINIETDEEMPDPYVLDKNGQPILDKEVSRRIQNNDMVGATIRYFDSEVENNHLSDEPTVEERGLVRIRGNSSREFDKKGYLLKFTEEDMVTGLDVSLSGMTADNSWVLHGPFLDKSLIRNYVCYNLSGEIMDYAPNVRFCEAFVNGEYMGVYLLVEKIGYNENGRIDITQTDPDLDATSYIVQADRITQDTSRRLITFGTYSYLAAIPGERSGQLSVVYPGKTLTEEQRQYVENDISKFEKALFSFDYKDSGKGYKQYIDVESFVDYFLINEFTLNYDAVGLSTFLYKDVDGMLRLCVWDFNSSFDYYQYSMVSPETFKLQSQMWYAYLFKDENFVKEVERRYYQLREEYFNEEYLFEYIDDTVAYLGDAVDRNFEKWGYSFQTTYKGKNYDFLEPEERNVRSYEEAIQQIKDCITQRIDHMDSNLDRIYILCHDSMNKKYNHKTEGGN